MEKRYSNALTLSSYIIFSSDYFFQSFCNIWVSVTPSDNSFTISPHNLALLHSTLLHSYPVHVPLKFMRHFCSLFSSRKERKLAGSKSSMKTSSMNPSSTKLSSSTSSQRKMNGFSTTEDDSRDSGHGQICCLVDDGQRCSRPAGNACYSKRIAKTVQQRKLKLTIDHSVSKVYKMKSSLKEHHL